MSWIDVPVDSDFSIHCLPYGVFSVSTEISDKRIGVAIGNYVIDMKELYLLGLLDKLDFDSSVFTHNDLLSFMSLSHIHWDSLRQRLIDLLSINGKDDRLSSNVIYQSQVLIDRQLITMSLPINRIGDYTDFYSSIDHARNVGIMFRGVDNALQPNWLHCPIGYHGRSSSIVVSGTPFHRPSGQLQADPNDKSLGAHHLPSKKLDFELELAFFIGGPENNLGEPISISEAENRIFGVVLMNDWSARDIQSWEYVPLGPFTAKNFCTTISPWIVPISALKLFRGPNSFGIEQSPRVLDYIHDDKYHDSFYHIDLQVSIRGELDSTPSIVTRTNAKYLYWNFKQQLVHHSITGCNIRPGDLMGTGTISGTTEESFGSLLELTWNNQRSIDLSNSSTNPTRGFLLDGDEVVITGKANIGDITIGFGECRGLVLPTYKKTNY